MQQSEIYKTKRGEEISLSIISEGEKRILSLMYEDWLLHRYPSGTAFVDYWNPHTTRVAQASYGEHWKESPLPRIQEDLAASIADKVKANKFSERKQEPLAFW